MPTKAIEYQIVEVDKELQLGDWSPEDDKALVSLRGQSGTLALLKKYRIRRNILESNLKKARHKSLDDVARLQGAIEAYSTLENEIQHDIQKIPQEPPRMPYALEQEAFDKLQGFLTVVK